jgi:integrase
MAVKVRQRDGAWWVFIDYKGQRKAKRVGTGREGKKAAELAATKIAARLAEGGPITLDPPKPAAKSPSFSAIAEEWLLKYPALHAIRPATLDNYRSFTKRHLLPALGHLPITDITAVTIEDFIEAKRAPGGSIRFQGKALSDASLRTGLLTLRLILQRAVRTKRIPANPMHEVDWRGMPRMEHVDPFTGAELRAILKAAREHDADFATLLHVWMQCGIRAGEACGLQWQDLDLGAGTALVRRTWSRQRLGPTKTGHERRVSILHPIADDVPDWRPGATEASRSVVAGLHHFTVRPLDDPEAFVFGRGKIPLASMELHRRWRRVLLAAKVRYREPEQLRHTFASTLLSRNAPLLYVQGQGGWRSASVLLRVYARWMPQAFTEGAQWQPSATPTQLTPPSMTIARGPSSP